MTRNAIQLTPTDVNILLRCPLHYHFLQQNIELPQSEQASLDRRVRRAIDRLHASGGPLRLSLDKFLAPVEHYPAAKKMAQHYFFRLRHDWKRVMATNETLSLRISIASVPLLLRGTIDRLDQTRDGGIVAVLFCTETDNLPPAIEQLRTDPITTIFHALVASAYPGKRPVRVQQLWLYSNQELTVELSEDEYRVNLGQLREPIRSLARGEMHARPGLHCETCPFKTNGCPVYSQPQQTEADDFALPPSDGKIQSRKWIFKE